MDSEVFRLRSDKLHEFGYIMGNTALRPFRLRPIQPSSLRTYARREQL